jgi:hypothetical protein
MFGFVEIYEPHGGPHMKPARAKPFPRPLGGFSNSGHESDFFEPTETYAGEEKSGI